MLPRGHRSIHSLTVAVMVCALVGLWIWLPDLGFFFDAKHQPQLFTDAELKVSLSSFKAPAPPTFDDHSRKEATLGRRLFLDPRFSSNGQISCGTCHQPGLHFTDGRPLAVGLATLPRHTPSLLNSFAAHWFFWDGRADSLSAQVQGPVEAPLEHGFDRGRVAQVLWQNYRDDFVSLFGAWPPSLVATLADPQIFSARPQPNTPALPLSLAHYALASIGKTGLQAEWISAGARAGIAPQRFLATEYLKPHDDKAPGIAVYRTLSDKSRSDLDRVFAQFGWALAQYERGLVALDSPFDRFALRTAEAGSPVFAADFAEKEWKGFRVFMESGCSNCHSGPLFTDQQFHNIGLPQGEGGLDLGRAAGIILAQSDPYNCNYAFFTDKPRGESCEELPYLKSDNLEMVGAFKTPSLRNVANTAPYMHDGRMATLEAVLEHYNELRGEPAVGHRDEILQPLRLSSPDLASLAAFLRSLSAPVQDLSAVNPGDDTQAIP